MLLSVTYFELDHYVEQLVTVSTDYLDKYFKEFSQFLVGKYDGKLIAIKTEQIISIAQED